jgi:hypothetical protein
VFLETRKEGDFLIKAGTVKELAQFEGTIDRDVYRAALRIVTMLDEIYGAERDVDSGDGGFVVIVESVQDMSLFGQRYMRLDSNRHETVDVAKCENGRYVNALFLCNNEFGINIFMPIEIAPDILLRNLPPKVS